MFAQTLAPQFNGASIIGNYPNTPFIFTVPISGVRPIKITCDNLPQGLFINENNGIITGTIVESGTYKLELTASNQFGETQHQLVVKIGSNLLYSPLMGWNSWNVFAEDISETLILEIAQSMVQSGMRDMGYQYINLDDFWHGNERDQEGRPTFDSIKFPNGMKFLADTLHSMGLKLGIYSCAGNMTCGEQFGGVGYEEIDAKTYAEWGIDLVKYDYCYAPYRTKKAKELYGKMGDELSKTDRSIVFSMCEWGLRKPWKWGREKGGHYWRITPDIFDVWEGNHVWHKSTESIIRKAIKVDKYAGVDSWNDMDMLIVGNKGKGKSTSLKGKYKGMTSIEYESHMMLWCLFKSPLIAGCDIRSMDDTTTCILTNSIYLKINQDTLRAPVEVIKKRKGVFVFSRPMSDGTTVIAVWNSKNEQQDFPMNFSYESSVFQNTQIIPSCSSKTPQLSELNRLCLFPHQTVIFVIRK